MGGQKWNPKLRGQNGSLKVGSLPSLHIFSSLWFFSLCFFSLFKQKEKNARRKHLKQKCKSEKAKAGAKSEKVEQELEGKLPPFSTYFFFSMVFFPLCLFFFPTWEKKDARKKHLKQKCKNGKAKARAKSERAKWELESKLPPFFWFFLLFSCVFFLLCVWKEEDDDNVSSSFSVVVL